ncbi:HIT family protein [Bacillus sp. V59.32b]
MDSEYAPDGYNVGWNCKETGGQSIPHAHLHIRTNLMPEETFVIG